MRIGIVPALNRLDGGVYQYSRTMLDVLHECPRANLEDEYVVFAHPKHYRALPPIDRPNWQVEELVPGWVDRKEPRRRPHPESIERQPDMRRRFERCGVELMIYPAPHRLCFEAPMPCVVAIHDLQHLLQPEFPEVSAGGEWERREYMFRNAGRQATILLADSEVGKEDIHWGYQKYGVTMDKISVLPFLPACAPVADSGHESRLRLRERHGLCERFFFYPAQYWPHKNHLRMVEAVGSLKREGGPEVTIVLTGSREGAIKERVAAKIAQAIREYQIDDLICELGYLPDGEVAALYAEAVGLVMPTFFGPTNIPILEAWSLGCPVLTSDIRGVREQAGDAAMLVDPNSVSSIADGMKKLWTDEALRRTLIERGRARLGQYTRVDYTERLLSILAQARDRVRSLQPCPR